MFLNHYWYHCLLLFVLGGICFISLSILNYQNGFLAAKQRFWQPFPSPKFSKWVSPLADQSQLIEEREHINAQRKALLQKACRENPVKSTLISRQTLKLNILWNREYDFAYCPNAKTGTSYWMRQYLTLSHLPQGIKDNFLRQTNLHTTMKQLSRLPDYSAGEKLAIFESVFSFAFVRHPFVKLVSTYQDKVIDHDHYRDWRGIITKNYTRVPLTKRVGKQDWPTFEEFVAFFLINGDHMRSNYHVITYVEKCNLCELDFDFIGKTETTNEDTEFIMHKTGLEGIIDDISSSHSHVSSGGSTEKLTIKYMKTLSQKQVQELYNYYKFDFMAFDYDPSEYYDGPLDL